MESSVWKTVMEQEKIRRGYDQVKNVFFVVGRKIHVLTEIERGEKR